MGGGIMNEYTDELPFSANNANLTSQSYPWLQYTMQCFFLVQSQKDRCDYIGICNTFTAHNSIASWKFSSGGFYSRSSDWNYLLWPLNDRQFALYSELVFLHLLSVFVTWKKKTSFTNSNLLGQLSGNIKLNLDLHKILLLYMAESVLRCICKNIPQNCCSE